MLCCCVMVGCSGSPSPLPVNAYWAWILQRLDCLCVWSVICTLSPCSFYTNPMEVNPGWTGGGCSLVTAEGQRVNDQGDHVGNRELRWEADWDVRRVWVKPFIQVKLSKWRQHIQLQKRNFYMFNKEKEELALNLITRLKNFTLFKHISADLNE